MQLRSLLCICLILGWATAWAQPCLPGWHYRTPVTLDNSANPNALVDYQVKLALATDALIAAGEMKADGGDIRFTNAAGVAIPHWIVNNTLNSAATEIWVNVDNIPPGSSIDIFLFYGRSDANTTESGDATFLHYDNFEGTALDFGKWTFCGPYIPVVSNGEVTFSSSSGTDDHMIRSVQTFVSPVTVEMKVNSVNSGVGMLGQLTATDDGYGMAFENAASVDAMRLVSLDPGVTPACLSLVDQSPVNSVSAGTMQGLWSFSWSLAGEQQFSWPGGIEIRNDILDQSGFSAAKQVVVGSYENTGSMSLDYIYTRKYSAVVPSFGFGARTELVDEVSASTIAPVCVGDTLKLFAPFFAGANYNWVGPNSYTSTDQNPVIPISNFGHVGEYVVTVAAPTGCLAVLDSVQVVLDSVPVAGSLTADATLCHGQNQGQLRLSGITGNILYWEGANSPGGPWNTIANTSDSLDFLNLINTQYYRAIGSMGACGLDTSNMVTLTVDDPSQGGNILGSTDVCFGFNSGTLSLINQVGNIVNWQSSTNGGTSWTDIATTGNQVNYLNLTDTTWYRVLVRNGVCDTVLSDTAIVQTQPLPIPSFQADAVCQNEPTNFVNQSTIPAGTIVQFNWDFGDGNGATNTTPIHTFQSPGTHSVLLEATTDRGCVDSIRVNISVLPPPTVAFSFPEVCDGATVTFTNGSYVAPGAIQTHSWDYGDGSSLDTTVNGSHLYSQFGTYPVQLTVVTDSGCVDSLTQTRRVLQRANVDFVVDSVCLNQPSAFDNLSSTFEDSTQYLWSFGNGQTSVQREPNYTYPTFGTFEVVLQATTFGQCLNTAVDTVVIHPLPETDFTFENECLYDPIGFSNQSSIAFGTVNYNWTFGDSTTGVGDSISHAYNVPGNYFVTLLATSTEGCTDDTTLGVEAFPVPESNFVVADACRDTLAAITNTSTISSGSNTYVWDLGDGTRSTAIDPGYTYTEDGDYDIQLIATSDKGCRDSIVREITVHAIPDVDFSFDPVCFGIPTELNNETNINAGFVATYRWNFGDQSFSFDEDVTHLYTSAGAYQVSLLATSNFGCSNDTTISITVNPFPEVDFDFENECVSQPIQFLNHSELAFGTMTYAWEFGNDSMSTQSSPTQSYLLHGFYPVELTATTDAGCVDSLTQVIEIYPQPLLDAGLDTSVSFGFSTQLAGISPAAVSVDWSPGLTVSDNGALVTEARPLETTTYTLTVTDQFGCTNSDDLSVEVINDYNLLISNLLTPNGDGKNDRWTILNADAFPVLHVEVFDRWGKPVYKVDQYTDGWDGTVGLDALPEGTYFYVITFDESDQVYKGAVSILREQE